MQASALSGERKSVSELMEEFGAGWNRFWFTAADPLPCCVLRVVVGLLAAMHFLDLASGLAAWYGAEGVLPTATMTRILEASNPTGANYHLSYLGSLPSGALAIVHGLAVLVALAFAAGFAHRVTGALLLLAVLAYVHRNPLVAGHVEPVLSFLIAYSIIGPATARFSIDQWLASRRQKGATVDEEARPDRSVAANVSLRLIQVHVAMFYAMMGLTKLYGDAWWDGNAIWILMAQTESRPLNFSGVRQMGQLGEYLLNFWTHAVVYFELAFPVLIWNRLLRPLLLVLSVAVWCSLILVTGHLIFGLTMLAAGVAFAGKWDRRHGDAT